MGRLTTYVEGVFKEIECSEDPLGKLKALRLPHRALSQIRGFSRISEDFRKARDLYNEKAKEILIALRDEGLLLDDFRYDTPLPSPEQRLARMRPEDYDWSMERLRWP